MTTKPDIGRPRIIKSIECSASAVLKRTGAAAQIMRLGLDDQTGAPCYVISADGSWPFAAWPDELADVRWAKKLQA